MQILRRFLADRSGVTAINFGLALTAAVGLGGAAVDYGRATTDRTSLQGQVDAAALAAAQEIGFGDPVATAKAHFRALPGNSSGLVVDATVEGDRVTVTASRNTRTALLGVVGISHVAVGASSTAQQSVKGPPICILALSRTASPGVSFAGNTSFSAKGCAVYSNSSVQTAISIQGSATATADAFCAVGGVSPELKPSRSGCRVQEDPFKNVPAPDTAGCTYSNKNQTSVGPNGTKTFSPGIYCETLEIKGTAILNPGTYVLKKGLDISAQGAASGTGVTFYLTGDPATFGFNGSGSLNLSAPTSGTYEGILIFQDRSAPSTGTNKLNGNSETVLKGAIYVPAQMVEITGSGTFGQKSNFMPIIADRVSFSGNSQVESELLAMNTPAPIPTMTTGPRLTH